MDWLVRAKISGTSCRFDIGKVTKAWSKRASFHGTYENIIWGSTY